MKNGPESLARSFRRPIPFSGGCPVQYHGPIAQPCAACGSSEDEREPFGGCGRHCGAAQGPFFLSLPMVFECFPQILSCLERDAGS